MRVKAILKDIGIVFGLTILWSSMNSVGLDDNAAVMLIILTFVYIFYGLAESCEDTGGTTESLLLIIKSVFVTMLSSDSMGNSFWSCTYRCSSSTCLQILVCVEKKTDLFEIIFLCVEAVGLSIYGEFHDIQGIGVLLFVFYEETAFFLLNYLVKEGAARYFGEAEDY